jgi:hypothetical protein
MQLVSAPQVSRLCPGGAGQSRSAPVKIPIQSATTRSAIAEAGTGVVLVKALLGGTAEPGVWLGSVV